MKKWLTLTGVLSALAGVLVVFRGNRRRQHEQWSSYTDQV